MSDKWIEPMFAAALIGIIVGGLALIWWGGTRMNQFEADCRNAGGVPFQPRSGRICLHPSAVIKVR